MGIKSNKAIEKAAKNGYNQTALYSSLPSYKQDQNLRMTKEVRNHGKLSDLQMSNIDACDQFSCCTVQGRAAKLGLNLTAHIFRNF